MWRYLAPLPLLLAAGIWLYWQVAPPTTLLVRSYGLEDSSASALEAALERKVAWEFVEMPLQEVAARISASLAIPVMIDERVLADSGIGTDTPISRRFTGISAKSALRTLLADHGLMFVLADEYVVITTQEEAQTRLLVRVYPVRDLVECRDRQGIYCDYDSLIEMLSNAVQPNSWRDGGVGEGSVASLPAGGALVISQTREVHEDIERLLSALRQMRRDQRLTSPHWQDRPNWGGGSFGMVNGNGSGVSGGVF